jgi:hypothetical protein
MLVKIKEKSKKIKKRKTGEEKRKTEEAGSLIKIKE